MFSSTSEENRRSYIRIYYIPRTVQQATHGHGNPENETDEGNKKIKRDVFASFFTMAYRGQITSTEGRQAGDGAPGARARMHVCIANSAPVPHGMAGEGWWLHPMKHAVRIADVAPESHGMGSHACCPPAKPRVRLQAEPRCTSTSRTSLYVYKLNLAYV